MGWFGTAGGGAVDPSLHVVTVRRAKDAKAVGAGFVLSPDTVLTCAHVVNAALGRVMLEPRAPGLDEVVVEVHTDGPGVRSHPARVVHWVAPHASGGGPVPPADDEWLGDLAVLRVDGPLGGLPAGPRLVSMAVGQELDAWHCTGEAATYASLTVRGLSDSRAYLDGAPTGMAVGPGYSGGPLWCPTEKAVVGLVVAHFMPPRDHATGAPLAFSPQHLVRRSWAVPWQRVESELRPLGALHGVVPGAPDPDDHAFLLLTEAIEDIFPTASERVTGAQRLARACGVASGSDVTPPTPEEFAAFLLTHPRALAALAGNLRRDTPRDADRVLAAGGLSHVPRLLSPQEHTALRKHLRAMEPQVGAVTAGPQ
ncbi:serine protease [Streptomyces ziwulingensis]|uniref:Serine protease n=1 Tax=Streptomyces ziwulingensis TaxID=1045501 RepID=A0ABP9CJH9_9ACTN